MTLSRSATNLPARPPLADRELRSLLAAVRPLRWPEAARSVGQEQWDRLRPAAAPAYAQLSHVIGVLAALEADRAGCAHDAPMRLIHKSPTTGNERASCASCGLVVTWYKP